MRDRATRWTWDQMATRNHWACSNYWARLMKHLRETSTREASGKRLESVWEASGKCLGSVWEVSGKCLGSVWEASGAPLRDICQESKRHSSSELFVCLVAMRPDC